MARADRKAGHRRSHRRPARRRRVRIAAVSSLLIGGIATLPPVSTWLRGHEVPVPQIHLMPSVGLVVGVLMILFFTVFVVVELILLAKAIATVGQPVLHERYKALMLHWPYALLTPYTIFKTNVLPRVFFGPDERRGADPPATGTHHAGSQRVARPNLPGQVAGAAAAEQTSPVTRDQYRSALALVIEQIDLLTADRELRDLLLEKYRSLESAAEGRSSISGDQVPLRLPKGRSSNRWSDTQSDASGNRDRPGSESA